jgi:hypothetical protein
MKLELKHLDFANNCKVRLTRMPHWDFENVNIQDCELSFNSSTKEPYLTYRDVTFVLYQIKLYKRPLSDLTKEIEVNGEKFVPLKKLNDECFGLTKYRIFIRQDNSIALLADFHEGYNVLNESTAKDKLLEWHFDIFNLIENNLAIDVNTLNK